MPKSLFQKKKTYLIVNKNSHVTYILPFEWMSDSSEEIIVIRVHLFERFKQFIGHMVKNVSGSRKVSTSQISKKP